MERLTWRRARDDEGMAMLLVIGTMVVMTLLVAVALQVATNYGPVARKDQDWNAALAAAQAGVDDYLAKLNRTDTYWTSIDCANTALQGPKAAGSCGWTSSTAAGWQDVSTADGMKGQFHYDVDTSGIYSDGSVRLTSTGKVNGVTRTLQVRVSKGGSTDYLYYTDFEDADPANKVPYPSGANNACGGSSDPSDWKYFWQTRSGCSEITFIGGDVLDGAAHFNDSPLMSSGSGSSRPKFLQGFETADPNCTAVLGRPDSSGNGKSSGTGKCWRSTSNTTPYVGTKGVTPAPLLYLPDSSANFVNYPGCQFTGDTRIRFLSDGTMDVWNNSGVAPIVGPGSPGGTNCGTAFAKDGSGRPSAKQNLPVPNDMVIYVKNSGTTAACVPGQVVNGSSSGSSSADVIPQGSGTTNNGVTDISYFDPDSVATPQSYTYKHSGAGAAWTTGTPSVGATTTSGEDHPSTYDCGSGNVYIEGTVKGRVTVASQNNIIVTDDLLISSAAAPAAPTGTDMVGLVASNSVVVYHPISRGSSSAMSVSPSTCPSNPSGVPSTSLSVTSLKCTWTTTTTYSNSYSNLSFPGQTSSGGNRWIYASIQTLAHSYTVQRYDKGSNLGTLSVRGSIAQKFRGAVGTGSGSTGYYKDYSYDQRLVFTSPPYFPAWTNAVWAAKTTGELKPQYGS